MIKILPIIGGYHVARSRAINDQACDNFMLRRQGGGAKAPITLVCTPGYDFLVSVGGGGCRSNGVPFQDKMYFVAGDKLIAIDKNDVGTEVGTLQTSSGRCDLDAGFTDISIVDGTTLYSYDGTTFVEVTDVDKPNAKHVLWLDQYYIYDMGGGGFQLSALNDPTTFDPTDTTTVEKRADDFVRPMWLNGRLAAVGTETIEIYWNEGNIDFPFTATDITYEYGTPASWSAVSGKNAAYMISSERSGGYIIVKLGIGVPRVISRTSPELEYEMGRMSTVSDAFAFVYSMDGQTFYQVTFPSADKTFVYDESTNEWHTRSHEGGRSKVGGYGFFNGKHIVGDYRNNNFYVMNPTTYTDNGDAIIRERRAPIADAGGRLMRFKQIEIDVKTGIGLTSGQGVDPILMLSWSDDGGYTWSSEFDLKVGKKGAYREKAILHGCGTTKNGRIFRIRMSDPVEWIISGATVNYELGR